MTMLGRGGHGDFLSPGSIVGPHGDGLPESNGTAMLGRARVTAVCVVTAHIVSAAIEIIWSMSSVE
jgi:hypothetical protein